MVTASVREWLPEDAAIIRSSGAIVMIHGSMDRQSGFRRLAKSLSRTHRVITYDRRGYAGSADIGGPFDVAHQVSDLLEVMDSQPAVLVGHSYGGAVALACASKYPDLVPGVVVYESPMSWEPWWPKDSGGARAVAMSEDPRAAAEGFLIRFIGALPDGRAVMLEGAHHNAHSAEPEAFERLLVRPLLHRVRIGRWPAT
ncbi:MAG: alpha/beta fold hydrolase [Actinomycetota bacterium]